MDANDIPDLPKFDHMVDKSGDSSPKTPEENMTDWLDSMADVLGEAAKADETAKIADDDESTTSIVEYGDEDASSTYTLEEYSDLPPWIGVKKEDDAKPEPVLSPSDTDIVIAGGGGGGGVGGTITVPPVAPTHIGKSGISVGVGTGAGVVPGGGSVGAGISVTTTRWLPGESTHIESNWYDKPNSFEREYAYNNGGLSRGTGVFTTGSRAYELQRKMRTICEGTASITYFTSGIPRQIRLGSATVQRYTYDVINERLVHSSVRGAFRNKNLADFTHFYADAARNLAMLDGKFSQTHRPMFGFHPDASVLGVNISHQPSTFDTIDLIRHMWDQYSGEAFSDDDEDTPAWNPNRNSSVFEKLKSSKTTNACEKKMHDDIYASIDVNDIVHVHYAEKAVINNVKGRKKISKDDLVKEANRNIEEKISIGKAGTYDRPNGEKYIARKVSVGSGATIYDVQMIQKAREQAINVLLSGRPGTGKTALCEAALENLQTIECDASTEAADFIGSYVPTGHDTFEWKFGPLAVAAMNGWPLLVDEIAMCDPRELPVVYSAMDGRKKIHITSNPEIGTIDIKDGFYVIGACNPDVPGAIMSDALLSRFPLQLEVTTDYSLLKQMGVDNDIIVVSANLAKQVEAGTVLKAPQTRELLAYKKLKETFGLEAALANFVGTADPSDIDTYITVVSTSFGKKVSKIKI